MSEEKKNEVTEEVKEARKLTEEELEQVTGGVALDIRVESRVETDTEPSLVKTTGIRPPLS